MDHVVKQRNRRRKRAQRMQAIRDSANNDSDKEEEIRGKPQRPPNRRKKSKEPLVEEDIIDGFAILGFKSYEDLETVLKIANKENIRRLVEVERPKHEQRSHITHHISAHQNHGLTLTQDPATSDDSGRASERLTGSSVAPRDADSSRDRLSDASSRCSSGKGYICDSEGEDDKDSGEQEDGGKETVETPKEKEGKQETVDTPLTSPSDDVPVEGSDASSVIFASTPSSRIHEFPGALPPSLPLANGTSNSPVPAPTPPNVPVPSPAPAQQPPALPIAAATTTAHKPSATQPSPQPPTSVPVASMPTVPVAMPQPAAAPVAAHHPPPLDAAANLPRTDSPAVAASATAAAAPGPYHPPYHQPLYTPYAANGPYASHSPAVATTASSGVAVPVATMTSAVATTPSHREAATARAASPRGHSPTRERESYSSNVSSLSRGSITPLSCPPPTTVSSSLALSSKAWSGGAAPQLSPAPPRPTPPLHSFPAPMFAAPLPPPVSAASPLATTVPPTNPNPFSAENLFQTTAKKTSLNTQHRVFNAECATPAGPDVHKYSQISSISNPMPNQADMLRRELDSRFLASQDRTLPVAPPPYLRTEMHQHQHHHTHVHQHTTSLLAPPPSSTLFPSPLFKDIPKLGSVESPFYRQNLGMTNYPGYTPGLLHPGLTTGPTPFVPPNHLPSFQPKLHPPDPTKPKTMKTGKWNAMHVRVAWEIYHHQQKGDTKPGTAKAELLRPPTHLFSPSVHHTRPHELPFPSSLPTHRTPAFDQPHPGSLFSAPPSHIGSTMSPFTRYGAAAGFSSASPFAMSPFAGARDLPLGPLHDPWRGLQRAVPGFPPGVSALPPTLPGLAPPAPWTMKPDPVVEQREREEREREQRERERLRREREERERREREEKQRRLEQQQQQERERERREKERRELERRELERERERERLLHHQRYESTKHLAAPTMRDRSPMHNGADPASDIRVKQEPPTKEEDVLARADHRYHPYLRHPPTMQPPGVGRVLASHGLPAHYPPPPAGMYPPTDFYRYDPLRYNPLMDAAIRAEEERAKLFSAYGAHAAQLRTKDPGLMHLRPGPGPPAPHKLCATPPTSELHKKEEPR